MNSSMLRFGTVMVLQLAVVLLAIVVTGLYSIPSLRGEQNLERVEGNASRGHGQGNATKGHEQELRYEDNDDDDDTDGNICEDDHSEDSAEGGDSQDEGSEKNKTDEGCQLPKEIDWREKGYVTPVQDQMPCDCCCWAFATAGAVEALRKKETGHLVPLSEQNLVDCIKDYNNKPECPVGENVTTVFEYIKKYGIATAESNPYTAKVNLSCHHHTDDMVNTIHNFVMLPSGDENALQEAVVKFGPVAAMIDSHPKEFKDYKGGIYKGPCGNKVQDLDHVMLAVGYGSENGEDYWILKNSWGTKFGENGYMRLARNCNNLCGVATEAYYVT